MVELREKEVDSLKIDYKRVTKANEDLRLHIEKLEKEIKALRIMADSGSSPHSKQKK